MKLIHGIWMRLERDRIALFEHRGRGIFEPDTVAAFTAAVESDPNACVIDVGAYTGLFTLLAIKAGAKEVIALEPNPSGHERLIANLEANGGGPVTVLRMAASSADGTGVLHIDPEQRGICSTGRLRAQRDGEPERAARRVELVRIDSLELKGRVSVMKLDVEGHELEALRGAEATLHAHHPVLFVEVNSRSGGDRSSEVTDLLAAHGYQGEPIDDRNMVFR